MTATVAESVPFTTVPTGDVLASNWPLGMCTGRTGYALNCLRHKTDDGAASVPYGAPETTAELIAAVLAPHTVVGAVLKKAPSATWKSTVGRGLLLFFCW